MRLKGSLESGGLGIPRLIQRKKMMMKKVLMNQNSPIHPRRSNQS
jgi:hypothetical protein